MKQIKKYCFSSKEKAVEFDLEIKMATDFKLYFSGNDIPEELTKSYGGLIARQNKFDSFNELNEKVLEIISHFEDQYIEETKKKVILYTTVYDERSETQKLIFT